MALRIEGIRAIGLFCFILAGCASPYLAEKKPAIQKDFGLEPEPAQVVEGSSEMEPVLHGQPCWHHIVYRGRVDWDGIFEGPIEAAAVSIYDGAERIHSTVTGPGGKFELPCDVFGRPCQDWKGSESWRPDSHYAIVAESSSGGLAQKGLQEVDPKGFVHLEITPP